MSVNRGPDVAHLEMEPSRDRQNPILGGVGVLSEHRGLHIREHLCGHRNILVVFALNNVRHEQSSTLSRHLVAMDQPKSALLLP